MNGKIIKVDGNKVTIRPDENFLDIQIDKTGSYLEAKIGREVLISFGKITGKVEILVNGGYFDGILV